MQTYLLGKSHEGILNRPHPGLTGVPLYTYPCHFALYPGSEWDSGRWQLQEPHTVISPALPHDPPQYLLAKENGLKDTESEALSGAEAYGICA